MGLEVACRQLEARKGSAFAEGSGEGGVMEGLNYLWEE